MAALGQISLAVASQGIQRKMVKGKWQESKEVIGQEYEVIVPVDKVLAFLASLPVLHFLHFASLVVTRVGGKSNQGPE